MPNMIKLKAAALAAVIGFGCAWGVSAQAQSVDMNAFYGRFEGMGVAEDAESIYFETTVRELAVEIRPNGNGFQIYWSTQFRKGGDPNAPKQKLREATIDFVPTAQPGIFASADRDPFGKPMWWAALRDQTLHTYMMQIDNQGRWIIQKYARTLTGVGMELMFERYRDGEDVRTVKGRLNRVTY